MKHKNKITLLRKNRGFAILFSLGILTVVLIVVMLFASQAKVSSTVSAIHLENQSARTLAKSLVPRIIMTINKSQSVQDQILYSSIYDYENDDLNGNYIDENLYSFDWIWKLEHPAHIKFTPTEGNNGQVENLGTFRYYMTDGKNKAPKFDVKNPFVPTWQYILDIPSPGEESKVDGVLGNRKRGVIARFAFVIIPKIAHLNPNALADHTHCQMLSQASVKKSGLSHGSCTKCARKLGNSPAELMFGAPEGLPAGTTATLLNTGDGYRMKSPLAQQFASNENNKWNDIQNFSENFDGLSVPGLDASEDEIDEYIANKNILTRFMDIDNAGDREAYWSDDGEKDENGTLKGENDGIRDAAEFYHRFNMRRTDWNDLKIEHIIADPVEWSDLGNKEPDISGSNNHNTGGIAWFKNWDDKGTWDSKEDKRNQVIANLLNYCSPPTRPVVTGDGDNNMDPEEWKTKNPKYTGLKRTLYINEYFYDLQFKSEVLLADYNDAIDKTDIEVAYKFNSQFMVELIDMYLNTLGDENNHPVKFEKNMQTPNFRAYKPEIYGKLTFEYMNPETGNYEQKEYDLEGLQFVRFEDTDKVQEIADADKKYGYYGYYTDKEDEIKFTYQAAGEVSEADVYKKTYIKNVKLKIDKILLYRNPTPTELNPSSDIDKTFPGTPTADKKEYVDCAIINYTETIPAQWNLKNADALYAICGDREVIDPRQNLRLKDWSSSGITYKRYTSLKAYNNGVKTLHTLPIQTYTTDENGGSVADEPKVTNKTLSIAANNPHIEKTANNLRDCEAADDPSWRLNGGIKVEPNSFATHISTAYIRHAILRKSQNNYSVLEHPMESLWELGAIHRAEKWQTLNISKSPVYESAKDFVKQGAGKYEDGDGPILDQVKMTNDCISFGKINLVRHVDQEVRDTVIGALFRDMPVHQFGYYLSQGLDDNGIEDLTLFPNKSYKSTWVRIHDKNDPDSGRANPTVSSVDKEQWHHVSYVAALYDVLYGDFGNSDPLKKDESDPKGKNKFWRRSDFLAAPKTKATAAANVDDMLYPIRQNYDDITDAMEEQIIGRTINLMKIDSTVKGATAILLVQTLKDSGNDITVFKDWDSNGQIAGDKKNPNDTTIAHFQAGYRRFSDVDESEPSFFQPPKNHYEQIKGFKGSYQNGADTITGETKVIITLDFDTVTQKWKMVKYEYAD